jgi:hypothetical protein
LPELYSDMKLEATCSYEMSTPPRLRYVTTQKALYLTFAAVRS